MNWIIGSYGKLSRHDPNHIVQIHNLFWVVKIEGDDLHVIYNDPQRGFNGMFRRVWKKSDCTLIPYDQANAVWKTEYLGELYLKTESDNNDLQDPSLRTH